MPRKARGAAYRRMRSMGTALAIALALASGCTRETTETAKDSAGKAAHQAERRLESAAAAFDDATITARVTTALLADPKLDSFTIDVDTSHAVVTLNGTVPSPDARAAAEYIARHTPGVKDVNTKLQVTHAS